MGQVIDFFKNLDSSKITITLIAIFIVIIVAYLIKKNIPQYLHSNQSKYRVHKLINLLSYMIIVIIIVNVYSKNLTHLSVFAGITGAGLAFAMKEIIVSFAGYIEITFARFYKVGDRILLGGIKGDVIDIGFLRTTLMEMGSWVDGDLYNGRITKVANSFVFKEPVYNYSADFPFVWDEIKVPIKTDGDFEWATTEFYTILSEVQADYEKKATLYWEKMTEKLMIENAQVEPMVKMTFNENWITFTLRYVVDYKKRRDVKDLISRKVLSMIRNSNGKVQVATSSSEVRLS